LQLQIDLLEAIKLRGNDSDFDESVLNTKIIIVYKSEMNER